MKLNPTPLAAAALAATATLGSVSTASATYCPPTQGDGCVDVSFVGQGHQRVTHNGVDSYIFENDGVTITAEGQKGNTRPYDLDYSSTYGIYMDEPGDSSHQIDGNGPNEMVWLTADTDVTWNSVSFSWVDATTWQGWGDDNVRILDAEGNTLGEELLFSFYNSYATLDLSGLNYTGASIGFEAFECDDDWKLKGVNVCPIPPAPPVSSVPTPSAAFAGLGLLGAYAIRRRRATHA